MSTGNGWNFYLSKIILLLYFLYIVDFDLSIASTKTKYIKLNTKTQNIFCGLNENLTTFSYTLTRKEKEKKVFSLKCIQKSNVIKKEFGF